MNTPASDQPASSPGPSRTCPHCGAVLPADAPEGQCPACLLLNLTLEPSSASPTQPAEAPQPPAPPLTPAELAPHFPQLEILECLGRGGMGVVYKARQKSLNRLVALKLLAPEREKDAAFAERFTREAQALAVLSHPHIVTIYDFGITNQAGGAGDGFYYLLMEYVNGVNLRHLLDQRKLTAEEALAIVPPLCDALQFAHERGIVHRDIKPENLLLDKRGQVKIADFGIAKMLGNGTPSHTMGGTPVETVPAPLGVTQPETALGTPAYMAPEQASTPERVDSRADIYSLGVVFYEMLTGELPARQLETTTSRLKNLHIDVRVDEIVLRALEKKPEMRWQTAAELRTRVEAVTSPPPLPPTPPPDVPPVPEPPPFRPWMQRFVAWPPGSRRTLFWCLMIAGMLAAALFMIPVEEMSLRPEDGLRQRSSMFGLPDPWFVEMEQRDHGSFLPGHAAHSPVAGSTSGAVRQLERSFRPLTISYALGLVAAGIWVAFWCFFAAEQRAGGRLPDGQRIFAMSLADRSEAVAVRIHWGRMLILLLAFLATVVTLSGHMSALMMLVLHDAPNPLFNAVFTAFFLSFVFFRGVAQELAGTSPSQVVAVPYARACGPTAAAAGFVTAYVAPFLLALLGALLAGHVRDRSLIAVFLVTWGVSSVVAHYLLSRRKLPEEDQRRWLRITSIAGWVISMPVIGFGIFFIFAAADEGFRWNPAPSEAFIVPIMWLGAVLLPVASGHLWHVTGMGPEGHPARTGRNAGRIALGILLLVAAVALPVLGLLFHFLSHTRAQVVYQQKRAVLERRSAIERSNLAEAQTDHRKALQEHDRAQDAQETSLLSRKAEDAGRSVARQEQLVTQTNRELAHLISPSISPVHPRFTALIAVSAICLVMSLAMFRRQPSRGTPRSSVLPSAATLLVLGAVAMMLSQIFSIRSRLVQPAVEVELPFAYNHTVRGNVLLVTLTALVKGGDVEGRVLLHGTRLNSDASALASRSHHEPTARPGLPNHEQPVKLLYAGSNEWRMAFAFPDVAMAEEASRNLRPVGILSLAPGHEVGAVLFETHTPAHGEYQGEIRFKATGLPLPPIPVEVQVPSSSASYDGILFRGTSVEYLPGTRHIQLHFTRTDNSGLGLETAQDINLSPDGKGPVAVGTPGWKLSHWVGPEGPHTLMWTLPAEFSNADMQGAVRELENEWMKPRMLPSGGVPLFARITHRDGWTCTLMARVLRSPGETPVQDPRPSTMPGGSPPGMPSQRPGNSAGNNDPPMQDTSDTALQSLSWHTFDQTPGQYWRQLSEVRRFREAAELIERYLALHPELDEAEQQINGANVHFHAAQCHASSGDKEKALGHLQKAHHQGPSPSADSMMWNAYVDGTTFFLLGERQSMLSVYEELASRSPYNHPNVIALDRLLANFGKPYPEAYESDPDADHKRLSADSFNRAWELLDKAQRGPEEDAKMLAYAHASLAHWRQREDCQTRQLSIAYWLLSRTYAECKDGISAQIFANLCLAVSAQEPPFYLGYAHEARARASMLVKDSQSFQKHLQEARAQASLTTEKRDREALEKDLDQLESAGNARRAGNTPTMSTSSGPPPPPVSAAGQD